MPCGGAAQPQQGGGLHGGQQREVHTRGHPGTGGRGGPVDHQDRQQRVHDEGEGGRHLGRPPAARHGRVRLGGGPSGQRRAHLPAALGHGAAGQGAARLPGPGPQEGPAPAAAETRAVRGDPDGRRGARDDDVRARLPVPAGHGGVGARGVPGGVGQRLAHDAVGRVREGALGQVVDRGVDPSAEPAEPGDEVQQPLAG